jgi:hypothetical protein
MKGEAYQAKDKATAPGGAGAQQQQRKRGPKAKGGNRASTKAQLDRLEKKLGWGGFDDKLPLEKVWWPLMSLIRWCHYIRPHWSVTGLLQSRNISTWACMRASSRVVTEGVNRKRFEIILTQACVNKHPARSL